MTIATEFMVFNVKKWSHTQNHYFSEMKSNGWLEQEFNYKWYFKGLLIAFNGFCVQ